MKLFTGRGDAISPNMFGLFFEDINFAADGGLYAELIENRSFEAKDAYGNPGNFYAEEDPGYAWSPVGSPEMKFVTGTPLCSANPHYLRFTATAPGQGFQNKAYDGIFAKKGETLHVVFYARAVRFQGDFLIAVQKDGTDICRKALCCTPAIPFLPFTDTTDDFVSGMKEWDDEIRKIRNMDKTGMAPASEWVKYETELPVPEDIEGARFAITLSEEGIVDFDFISVIPKSAVAGVFRKDIFEVLREMHPGFIRFPGGCIVEGISLENRYRWKNTVDEPIKRRYIPNLWAFDDDRKKEINAQRPDSHYGQSFGLGFYEYFLLCELVGAKPLPVLSMGVACQFRSTEMFAPDSPEFEEMVQDALDLIEFANGPKDSKWGSLRAKMGHPESFGMDMIAIGNEQWETKTLKLFERNDRFEKAIHAKYPGFRLLGTAGPIVDAPITAETWNYYREGVKKDRDFCYAVDEHYYKSPEWMYGHVTLYDNYPKEPAVFAGEYAAHTADRANSMESALAEAAMMTGFENNAGVVKLASYAPLFNRIGHSQWKPDMIWFDAKNVFLTPNYYVQKLFACNLGAHVLELSEEALALREKGIYLSASETDDGAIIIKAVNTTKAAFSLALEDADAEAASIQTLRSAGTPEGEMPEPSSTEEATFSVKDGAVLPAESFSVITI